MNLIYECFRLIRSVFVYHYSTISGQFGLMYSMHYDNNVSMLWSCDSFYKTIAMFCFLIKEDPSEATGVSLTSTTWTKQFVLLDEEQEGQPGEKEKPGWAHYHHPRTTRKMRERNDPTIKEVLLSYIPEKTFYIICQIYIFIKSPKYTCWNTS